MEKYIEKIEENTETIKALMFENEVLIALVKKMRLEDEEIKSSEKVSN